MFWVWSSFVSEEECFLCSVIVLLLGSSGIKEVSFLIYLIPSRFDEYTSRIVLPLFMKNLWHVYICVLGKKVYIFCSQDFLWNLKCFK